MAEARGWGAAPVATLGTAVPPAKQVFYQKTPQRFLG
jgi:hypothetical protein